MANDFGFGPGFGEAVQPLIDYCATSPAIECGEGYWDDMESACFDGERQEQSRAAAIMRGVLIALGVPAPDGLETCPDCYHYADGPGRGIDHSSQCQLADESEPCPECDGLGAFPATGMDCGACRGGGEKLA